MKFLWLYEDGSIAHSINPRLLPKLYKKYLNRWVPVDEALPPEGIAVLVVFRACPCPAFAWLKFAAGCKDSPYFACPQRAALGPRGQDEKKDDITFWYSHTVEGCLPWRRDDNLGWSPKEHATHPFGLSAGHGFFWNNE